MADQSSRLPSLPVTVVVPFGTVPEQRFGAEVEPYVSARAQRLIAALGREAARCAGEFAGTTFTSVYLAGGPTNLTLDQLYAVLQLLYDNLAIVPEEQSLELVPGTVDAARAKILKESGFDQLNLRLADAGLPGQELDLLAEAGFDSVGVEMSFGAGVRDWPGLLDRLVELKPARIHFLLPQAGGDREVMLRAMAAVRERLTDGWREFLLHHYCRPGHESRHLLALWSDSIQLGLGPAAPTRTAPGFRRNPAKLGDYLALAESGRAAKLAADRAGLLAALVRLEGIRAEQLRPESLRGLLANGLLVANGDRFFLTDRGALALDHVGRLLA
uniref:HemN C-terminal domain-containing protein n=1 Tax=candidate division WOR-3 bacterium TaxID=2052148 RepID=A0A7C4CBB6_UNCW3